MILRFLLPFLIIFPLYAVDSNWYSTVDTKIEASMYLPLSSGSISNSHGSSDFYDDFGYTDLKASHFSIEFLLNDKYVPNISISYFRMDDNKDVNLTKSVVVADGTFDALVSTDIKYSILDVAIYQDFKKKGRFFKFIGKQYYSGDIEFDAGLNAKMIYWKFNVKNKSNLSQTISWIKVDEFIPLPYIGVKYYLYDFSAYANISALAFSRAKSTSYQIGVDYRVINTLYLSAGYLYEQFKAVEKLDTVEFETTGYKFGFKYIF